jgi:hypothetical protein
MQLIASVYNPKQLSTNLMKPILIFLFIKNSIFSPIKGELINPRRIISA